MSGVMFFLMNYRPDGNDNLKGAGIAIISISDSYPPVPSATRFCQYWWDGSTEPWYGDVGAIRSGNYIYAYGHGPGSLFVYLTRVPWRNATDLSYYEYWNGESWQTDRLINFGEKERVFWAINQGQVIWSNYYECYLFIYCGKFWWAKFAARRRESGHLQSA